MNIAIIGTGNIGSGLARVFGKTSNGVVIADQKGAQEAALKLKAEGVLVQAADVATAIAQSDVVILATPYAASLKIASDNQLANKIVVDLSNPITEDFSGLTIGHTTSAAEEIAAAAPQAKVVKAFNTVFAQHYGRDLKFGNQKIQTFIASDDEAAKATVLKLAEEIGLEPKDAGPLKNARYLEPLGFMNITFGYILGQGTEIAPLWASA